VNDPEDSLMAWKLCEPKNEAERLLAEILLDVDSPALAQSCASADELRHRLFDKYDDRVCALIGLYDDDLAPGDRGYGKVNHGERDERGMLVLPE
jgi:hypothetical protein